LCTPAPRNGPWELTTKYVLSSKRQPHHRRNLTDLSPTPNPPNPHRSIDHSPTKSKKRPTKSQIAPLETVPVFLSPFHTPHTALASPPFPSHPGTSIPIDIDHRLEGLQMANNRRRARKKRTKPSQRMYFLCNVLQRLLNDLM